MAVEQQARNEGDSVPGDTPLPLSRKRKNYVNFPNIFGVSERLNDRYWECFKAHDNMYGIHRQARYPEVTDRLEADRRMHACLLTKGCSRLLAGMIYAAVRCFGSRYWK